MTSWLEFEMEFKKQCDPNPKDYYGNPCDKETAYVYHLDKYNRTILRELLNNSLDPRYIPKTEENFTKVRQFVHDKWADLEKKAL